MCRIGIFPPINGQRGGEARALANRTRLVTSSGTEWELPEQAGIVTPLRGLENSVPSTVGFRPLFTLAPLRGSRTGELLWTGEQPGTGRFSTVCGI